MKYLFRNIASWERWRLLHGEH